MSWPDAVSDGLTLPCGRCGMVPRFDYRVKDEVWAVIPVPVEHRRGVICLPCLDVLASEVGIDIGNAIEEVQYTGLGKTVVLSPLLVHRYPSSRGWQGRAAPVDIRAEALRLLSELDCRLSHGASEEQWRPAFNQVWQALNRMGT